MLIIALSSSLQGLKQVLVLSRHLVILFFLCGAECDTNMSAGMNELGDLQAVSVGVCVSLKLCVFVCVCSVCACLSAFVRECLCTASKTGAILPDG